MTSSNISGGSYDSSLIQSPPILPYCPRDEVSRGPQTLPSLMRKLELVIFHYANQMNVLFVHTGLGIESMNTQRWIEL